MAIRVIFLGLIGSWIDTVMWFYSEVVGLLMDRYQNVLGTELSGFFVDKISRYWMIEWVSGSGMLNYFSTKARSMT